MNGRGLFLCWTALVLLSLGTVGSLALVDPRKGVLVLLLLALAKAWLIVDGFMEMHRAPGFWRALMLAWPVTMAVGVAGVALI